MFPLGVLVHHEILYPLPFSYLLDIVMLKWINLTVYQNLEFLKQSELNLIHGSSSSTTHILCSVLPAGPHGKRFDNPGFGYTKIPKLL